MDTTDCRPVRHCSEMMMKNFLNNQMVHIVGMRQSAATQVTDIRYKRLGKAAGDKTMAELRELHMLTANKQSAAYSKHLDLMRTCRAI